MRSAGPTFDGTYRCMNQHAKVDIRHSTCPHDCPSACALDIEVIDSSTIGRVRGSKLQSYTAGVVCAKVARYAERIHHPDRLTYPRCRVGPKGSGKFARISWDDALDEIAARFDQAEREFGASPRRLSPALYGVDDEGRVVPYRRTADDELAKKVDLAHERLAMYEYGNQKEYFDAANEREGVDVFIASYQVFKSEDGALNVMSLWTETVHTVLPRTRTVALNVLDDTRKKSKRIVRVPFEALLDRLKRVEGAHPELWETSGKFPSSEELDAFAARYPQEP